MNYDTIKFTTPVIKHKLAKMVEELMVQHIISNRRDIVNHYFPNMSSRSAVCIAEPQSMPMGRPVGTITGASHKRIHRWHGDLAFVINSQSDGKVALIFEIKFGHIQITAPQQEFFKKITKSPAEFMDSLSVAKVIIVNCHTLDIANNSIGVRWYDYLSPEEQRIRWENHNAMKEGV